MTRLGLLVRADDRGIAQQSDALYHCLQPAKTLIVDMHKWSPYPCRPEKFPGAPVAVFDNEILNPPALLDWFLSDIDAVLSVETFYQDSIPTLCRIKAIRTFLMANWEFMRWIPDDHLPRPDTFLAPSVWHMDEWPKPHIFLPPPVVREWFPFIHRTQVRRFLHVAGHGATHDRSGTDLVIEALQHVQTPIEFVMQAQDGRLNLPRNITIGNVQILTLNQNLMSPAAIYAECDVLVAPRRYGGLSLPLAEASSLGMPVIALNREPENRILPASALIPTAVANHFPSQGPVIEVYDANPVDLAAKIDQLAKEPELVSDLSKAADTYAQEISWLELAPRYRAVLAGEGVE